MAQAKTNFLFLAVKYQKEFINAWIHFPAYICFNNKKI